MYVGSSHKLPPAEKRMSHRGKCVHVCTFVLVHMCAVCVCARVLCDCLRAGGGSGVILHSVVTAYL